MRTASACKDCHVSTPTLSSPTRTGSASRFQRPVSRPRLHIVPPELRISDGPAAGVLRVARSRGPLSRDVAAKATGLSIATVNRQVSALLDLGLLRERGDLTPSGAIGRPRVPFEVNHEPYLTVGIHIGAVVTSIIASDLRGKVLGAVEVPTPQGASADALAGIARSARAFASRWHRRRPLWAGVALGGRVDPQTGVVDHPRLGWKSAQVGAIIATGLGLPVSVAAHVEAMAASELLLSPDSEDGVAQGETGLYFYARETAGIAITIDGRVHTPSSGPGSDRALADRLVGAVLVRFTRVPRGDDQRSRGHLRSPRRGHPRGVEPAADDECPLQGGVVGFRSRA